MFYYKDYYDEIKKYSFILFLLDEEKIEYFPYFHYKYTSSLATAISFGIIPIVDQNTANIYKITDFSIIYHKYLDEAIDKISNMNENDYLNLKLKIFNFKNIYLNKNIKTFIKLLNLNHDFNNSHKEDCKC
ncbi:MAG: hypothetical protein GYA62_06985 [Bacteroidales bacterium]|nr:hypothetical protein [Bacteroidales bacterium]